MTGNSALSLLPIASFVVERVPGKGYIVTSADGPMAAEWKDRALALLDDIGQPDPKGPEQFFRWVGPVPPSGEYVGTVVKLKPNGEARYDQSWFRLAQPMARRWLQGFGLLVAMLVVGLITGFYVGRTRVPDWSPQPEPPPEVSTPTAQDGSKAPPRDPRVVRFNMQLDSTRDVREKLIAYLSQEGFSAPSGEVVDVKRSIKMIADLDTSPPPRESIRLSNTEVAKLLDLLNILEEVRPALSIRSDHSENVGPRDQ